MSDTNSKPNSKTDTPIPAPSPSGPASESATAPAPVVCVRCGQTVTPTAKHRCSNCGVFLPGNPGNPKPTHDMFTDWKDQLIEERGGPDAVSLSLQLDIENFVTNHRAIRESNQRLTRVGAHSDEGKQIVITKSRLHDEIVELERRIGIGAKGDKDPLSAIRTVPTSVLETALPLYERLGRGEVLSDFERGRLDLCNDLLDGSLTPQTPAPRMPAPTGSPEVPPVERLRLSDPRAAPAPAALPEGRPAPETPASEAEAAPEYRPRTVAETAPADLDDETRIAIYGETEADIEARRRRATDTMLANLGKDSPWLK